MSTTPDTTVVVVEERRRRFPVPLVAAVAGAALLGGTTFALWTAYGSIDGGRITAGNLDLSLTSEPLFYDVSDDRIDAEDPIITGSTVAGHAIDPEDWRIVPGDKVAMVYDALVILEGDNMVASLSVTKKPDADLNIEGMTYSYEIYYDDEVLVEETELGEEDVLLYLAAPETPIGAVGAGVDAEDSTPVHQLASGGERFVIVIYGTFDEDVVETEDSTHAYDELTGIAVTLTQVRDQGAVFNP